MRRCSAILVLVVMLSGVERCRSAELPVRKLASSSALQRKVAAAVARDLQSGLISESSGSNLQVLSPPLSVPAGAELHVTSVRVGYSPGSWLLRMDCSSRRDCLPFHVILHSPAASLRDGSGTDLAVHGSAQEQSTRPAVKSKQLRSPLARSGDHVLLVEERSGMRLKVTAVCLESGGLGDEIRVRNLATRRVLLATVAGKDLVRVE